MSDPGRVLFFGKSNCAFSKLFRDQLKDLGFSVQEVWSSGRGEDLPEEAHDWVGEFIFCFRSRFILPRWLIDRAERAAVNIHPGPPEYRGSGCINWALYDRALEYGATAHFINQDIDAGQIIAVRRFAIDPRDSVQTLLQRTHEHCLDLAIELATGVAKHGVAYLNRLADLASNEKWSGPARRMASIDSLSQVDPTISRQELDRVIRATHTPEFPTFVEIRGYRFILDTQR